MDALRIQGGSRLSGTLTVDGSKNAALPALAAALLCDGTFTLRGVPPLQDIQNMTHLLSELGCDVHVNGRDITVETNDMSKVHAPYDIVRTMRASICVLGPLLAARGEARVAMPGGCAIGDRPVDLHLRGLKALGATVSLEGGDMVLRAPELRGTTVFMGGPFGSTVLGTANVLCAAVLARGETVIESAACEPEVAFLATMLRAMGADIEGEGTPRIRVRGVSKLNSVDIDLMPDRIVAGTLAVASAITNGDVQLDRFPLDHLLAVNDRLAEAGVHIEQIDASQPPDCCSVKITTDRRLRPILFTTQPHPGFPTDLQAQVMSLLCLADGNSIVTEKIYPDRFLHVPELARIGATVIRQGATVVVQGVDELVGAPVMASDLRGGAALVLAGLAAQGETLVRRIYHVDRGYLGLEDQLTALGASIERVDGGPM
ncbi:MAG: UDP-N-acetylglucosamine 1-carboxyvinyltransferase [Phycisphaerales bacterium]|nr:UDP-N-acetylglucosamine 1-carboxyvinyltransferase [Phycisphaerales bacterium]